MLSLACGSVRVRAVWQQASIARYAYFESIDKENEADAAMAASEDPAISVRRIGNKDFF